MTRIRFALLALMVSAATPARAQLVPLQDDRFTQAAATLAGITNTNTETATGFLSLFNSFLSEVVEHPDPEAGGYVQSDAFQNSQFFPAAISASGSTSGYWVIGPAHYSATSFASFRFAATTCIDYSLDVWVDAGNAVGPTLFKLRDDDLRVTYHQLNSGELHATGRLSAGEYDIFGLSAFSTSAEMAGGGTYSYLFTCVPCSAPLIASQPVDRSLACGSTTTFSVTTHPPASTLSFQWRRNGVPLTESAHTSGVATPTLTVTGACHADTGSYDVIVSNGTVQEPSRPADLAIETTVGVEPAPQLPSRLAIALSGANPTSRVTALRYSAHADSPAQVTVHDITGACVATLAERLSGGPGVLQWDGRTSQGARARAGVYFVRIAAGVESATCRIVRLD